jgi:hypothetical protein
MEGSEEKSEKPAIREVDAQSRPEETIDYRMAVARLMIQVSRLAAEAPEEYKEVAGRLANIVLRGRVLWENQLIDLTKPDGTFMADMLRKKHMLDSYLLLTKQTNQAIRADVQFVVYMLAVTNRKLSQVIRDAFAAASTEDVDSLIRYGVTFAKEELRGKIEDLDYSEGTDWSGDKALFFVITLPDAYNPHLFRHCPEVIRRFVDSGDKLRKYFNFQTVSERAARKGKK